MKVHYTLHNYLKRTKFCEKKLSVKKCCETHQNQKSSICKKLFHKDLHLNIQKKSPDPKKQKTKKNSMRRRP